MCYKIDQTHIESATLLTIFTIFIVSFNTTAEEECGSYSRVVSTVDIVHHWEAIALLSTYLVLIKSKVVHE